MPAFVLAQFDLTALYKKYELKLIYCFTDKTRFEVLAPKPQQL